MNPSLLPPANGTPVSGGFDAAMQQAQAQPQPQAAPVAAPQHSGNWFTHLLPTIGGIGGSILGGLATAGLGGEVVGGAGGSALGKGIENALEGKQVLQGNDVTAGLEGGIGAGVGGVAGKVLGKAGEFLGNRGAALKDAAAQEAEKAGAKDSIDSIANTYKDVNPQLQGNLGAKDALQHVSDMGYDPADPANLVHVSNTSNDILNDTLNKALADSGPVDVAHYPQMIKDAIAKESGTLGSFEPTALSRGRFGPSNTPATKLLTQLEDLGAGVAKTNADPNEIRTLITKLGNVAADAKPMPTAATGAVDPVQRSMYNTINEVRGQLKDALYNRPELNDSLTKLTGNIVPDEATNITPQLAEHLNGVISGAGKNGNLAAQDLLDSISKHIDIGKLGEEGQRVGQIVSSTGGKARAAAEAGLIEPTADGITTPTLADAAVHVATNPAGSLVGTALKAGSHVINNPALLSVMSRIGGLGEKLAPSLGVAAATAPNLAADPVAGAAVPGQSANGTMEGNMNSNDLANYIHAMEAQSALGTSFSGPATSFMASAAPMIQHNQMLASQLHGMPGLYANAGGAQGIPGILSHLSGLIPGTAAHTYEAQQADLARQLGINPNILPSLMQNGNTADLSGGIMGQLSGQLAY